MRGIKLERHEEVGGVVRCRECKTSGFSGHWDFRIPHQYLLYFGFDNLNTPHLFYNFNFTSYNLLQFRRDCLGFNIHFMLPTH